MAPLKRQPVRAASARRTPRALPPMRVGFIHPDLGIGGAERLVVDAAVALQRRGHSVEVFTSRHDPTRCFSETQDGTLKVHVLGNLLPRSLFNALHIIFAILRQLHLTLALWLSLSPLVPLALKPIPDLKPFDVFFVDQLSVCVPLLRWLLQTRVVFYCHFPDKLLSGGWDLTTAGSKDGPTKKEASGLRDLLKGLYRLPVDLLEEFSTGQADVILANSLFTSRVYKSAFSSLKTLPEVVYPGLDLSAFTPLTEKEAKNSEVKLVQSDRRTLLSLNRFEGKKNVALAIEAFARLNNDAIVDEETFGNLRLVLAGGFDTSVQDNVQTLARLKSLCRSYGLSSFVLSELSLKAPPADTQVLFVQNFSNLQRRALLTSPSTIALLYTPSNEHFGIVPTEAMACGLPVLATNTGGPIETVVDRSDEKTDEVGTGLLRAPEGPKWADALAQLVMMKNSDRQAMGEEGKRRVRDLFALERMGEKLDRACRTAEEMGAVGLDEGRLLLVGAALAAVAAGLYYALVPSLLG